MLSSSKNSKTILFLKKGYKIELILKKKEFQEYFNKLKNENQTLPERLNHFIKPPAPFKKIYKKNPELMLLTGLLASWSDTFIKAANVKTENRLTLNKIIRESEKIRKKKSREHSIL